MREIKFRAWNKRAKEMIYFDLCKNYELFWNFIKETTAQYTGLKDSELNEEYFGDVIEGANGTRWVIEEGSSAVLYKTVGSQGVLYYWNLPPHKVIGNIYENPELSTQ